MRYTWDGFSMVCTITCLLPHPPQDNKQLQLYLERSEQEVERSSSQLASSDLLVQQLTAQVDQLQESDHEALRKERNSLQEE